MKKKVLTIALAVIIAVSFAFIVPDTKCFAAAKAKYVKVKQVTYNKMKKTIASQKKTIASQKKTITNQQKTIADQQNRINQQNNTINNNAKAIEEKDATIKEKKSTISWLWSSLEEFGYFYNYDTHKWERQAIPIEQVSMDAANDVIPMLEEQTGLTIDHVEMMDAWKTWYAFYVEADGDLYVITVKNKVVDVVAQLN